MNEELYKEQVEQLKEFSEDHEQRLRSLERGHSVMEATVNNLCERLKQTTDSINKLVDAMSKLNERDADKWRKFIWEVFKYFLVITLGIVAVKLGVK